MNSQKELMTRNAFEEAQDARFQNQDGVTRETETVCVESKLRLLPRVARRG